MIGSVKLTRLSLTNKRTRYLPFITSENSRTKQIIRLLIDTGANKNVIRPGIITNCIPSKDTTIKNIAGNHTINRKGRANLIGYDLPTQHYYELNFHDFFDGIIGSEFLAKYTVKIDYGTETIPIGNIQLPYEKYFPARKLFSHNIQINTTKDGDWLVPTFQKLYKSIIIEPGLYQSKDKKSIVKILTNKKCAPTTIKINNYETITPIPIEPNDKIIDETLEKIIITTRQQTEFLGHVITQEGIKQDPEKVKKILDWKLPENQKQIKQFLGLSGYYRRFIRDYSRIVKPMTKFLKKD